MTAPTETPPETLDVRINRRGYAPSVHRGTWREVGYWPRRDRAAVAEAMEEEALNAYGDWWTNDGAFGS